MPGSRRKARRVDLRRIARSQHAGTAPYSRPAIRAGRQPGIRPAQLATVEQTEQGACFADAHGGMTGRQATLPSPEFVFLLSV